MASNGEFLPSGGVSRLHQHVSKDNTRHIISDETSSQVSAVSQLAEDEQDAPFLPRPDSNTIHRSAIPPVKAEKPRECTQKLTYSFLTLPVVLAYIGLFLFSWIVFCLLTYNPISAKSYGQSHYDSKDPAHSLTSL